MEEKNFHKIQDLLFLFFKEINKTNINYWLDAGTLLKAHKSNFKITSILHSSDLDLGFYYKDHKEIIKFCKKIEQKGFKVKLQTDYPYFEDIIKIYLPLKNLNKFSHIDLYIYKLSKQKKEYYRRCINKPFKKSTMSRFLNFLIFFISSNNNKNKIIKKIRDYFFTQKLKNLFCDFIFFKFYFKNATTVWTVVPQKFFSKIRNKTIKFSGKKITVKIPKNYADYLSYRYGSLWKKNRSDWRPSDGKYLRFRKINFYEGIPLIKREFNINFKQFTPPSRNRNYRFNFSNKEIKKIQNNEK